jgi:hypothetical protein
VPPWVTGYRCPSLAAAAGYLLASAAIQSSSQTGADSGPRDTVCAFTVGRGTRVVLHPSEGPGVIAGQLRRPSHQQPAVHFPAASNSIVLPESGTWTGTLTALTKAAVLLPGRTLPPTVPTSFACDAITSAGFTSSLMT